MSTGQAPSRKPSGTIGLATRDLVYAEFAMSLARLDKPKDWEVYAAYNYDLTHARNFMVENFKGDLLWLMDDDHTFGPDILRRLIAHDKDIVGPLVLGRRTPFKTSARIDGEPLDRDAEPGLYEVDYAGGAGLLIKRHVFEAIEPPWFWNGRLDPDDSSSHQSDDYYFCEKAREAGFSIYCDTSVLMGHMTVTTILPEWKDSHNQWFTRQETAGATTWYAQEEAPCSTSH